jgi:hypothetical protein
MILEVTWDGLWTLSFGLSEFHGHRSWLVCEVALKHQVSWGDTNDEVVNLHYNLSTLPLKGISGIVTHVTLNTVNNVVVWIGILVLSSSSSSSSSSACAFPPWILHCKQAEDVAARFSQQSNLGTGRDCFESLISTWLSFPQGCSYGVFPHSLFNVMLQE